jgi:hypothetical protein
VYGSRASHETDRVAESAIECGEPQVAGLLAFVAARVEEDRLGAQLTTPVDESLVGRCDVVERVLLDMARDACRPGEPCPLPERCLRALGEYAFAHSTHHDFHPAWLAWRILP